MNCDTSHRPCRYRRDTSRSRSSELSARYLSVTSLPFSLCLDAGCDTAEGPGNAQCICACQVAFAHVIAIAINTHDIISQLKQRRRLSVRLAHVFSSESMPAARTYFMISSPLNHWPHDGQHGAV